MNKIACQYAIIRFAPYVETGEFANVGILMIAPEQRYFDFKLETRRYGRVTRFFEELETGLYQEALHALKDELQRIQVLLEEPDFEAVRSMGDIHVFQQLFDEVIRPRESIVRFSEPRIMLAEDPLTACDELFAFYIERNFVTKEYRETVLEKGVRQWLQQAKIADRFQRLAVGDESYQRTFPFVEQVGDKPVKVIKPLNLAHDQPSKIIDHGGSWIVTLDALKRRNQLPDQILFTIDSPANDTQGKRADACNEIVERLQETGVEVIQYANRERVLAFAQA